MVISKDDDNHLVWWLTNSILVYRDGPWILKERNKRTVKLGRWTLRSSYVFFPLWNTFLKLITFWCLYLEKESRPYVTGLPRFRRRLRDNPLVFLFTFLPRLSFRRKYLSAADGGVSVAHRRAASFFFSFHYFTVSIIMWALCSCRWTRFQDYRSCGFLFHFLSFFYFIDGLPGRFDTAGRNTTVKNAIRLCPVFLIIFSCWTWLSSTNHRINPPQEGRSPRLLLTCPPIALYLDRYRQEMEELIGEMGVVPVSVHLSRRRSEFSSWAAIV